MLKATPIQRKYVQNLTAYLLKVVYCGEMQIFLDLWELYCCLETQSEESNLFCCAPKPSYDHSSNDN